MKLRFSILALLFVFIVGMVSAHEEREVGDYALHFGWRSEPALAGLLNGPEVFISPKGADEEAGLPDDVEVSLQVEITFGSESKTIALRQAWQEPGHFIADLIPTLPGDYSFRVFGTIGTAAIDETFTSTDGKFSSVEPSTDIMFPAAGATDVAALLARLDALEARIAKLEGK